MKPYTVMPNNIAKVLNSPDTYRYVALSFSPLKNDGYTDSTFIQIGEYINPDKPESPKTTRNFVERLKKARINVSRDKDLDIPEEEKGDALIYIDSSHRDEKNNRRNRYYVPQPQRDFRMIKKEFLYLDLDIKLKGFLLQLLSITINETLQVGWPIARICREVNVSRPAASKYMKELIEKGFVKQTDEGYELISEYFILGKTSREKEIDTIREFAKISKFFTDRFNSIKWGDVRNPKEYWEASVIMRLRGEEKLRGGNKTDNKDLTIIL